MMSSGDGFWDFKFEKSTLNVSFPINYNGRSFTHYLEFIDRNKIISTEKIRFDSGFLASTKHYAQCFITPKDSNMYVKFHLEGLYSPLESKYYDLCPPGVRQRVDGWQPVMGRIVDDALKTDLINRRYIKREDFDEGESSKIFWFFWELDSFASRGNWQQLIGKVVTLDFDFAYRLRNKNKKCMHLTTLEKNDAVMSTKEYLFSKRFSDFRIECGEKSFPTHRNILASKSPVFSAMLEQPLKEMNEGRLVIEDFEADPVEEFIRFIYTGNANVDEHAVELFKLANKYEIAGLNLFCEAALISQVNEENLAETHQLAKIFNSEKLYDKCYSVFKSKRSVLLRTPADAEKFSDFLVRFALE